METAHTYNVQATASGNAQVSVNFSPKISTFIQFMKGAVPSFQVHSCSSDGKLSNGAKIAAIYMVFMIRILRN